MVEQSSTEIIGTTCDAVAPTQYRVLYDDQCEICQSSVAWLTTLDDQNKTVPAALGIGVSVPCFN